MPEAQEPVATAEPSETRTREDAAAAADKAFEAAFAEHIPAAEGDDEDDEKPAEADEDGQSEEAEDDEEGQESGLEDSAKDEQTDEEEPDKDDEELALHRAWTLLSEAGIPTSVLKLIKRTPKHELIAWAEREVAKAAASEPTGDAGESDDTSDGAKTSAGPAQGDADLDWAAVRQGIQDKLGVDEEGADALKPLYDAALLGREAKRELEQVKQALAEIRQAGARSTIDTEMQRLKQAIPALKTNRKARDEVVEWATALAKTGKFTTAREVFDAAVKHVPALQKPDLSAKQRNGVSTPPPTRTNGARQFASVDEYQDETLRLIESGKRDAAFRLRPPPPQARRPGR